MREIKLRDVQFSEDWLGKAIAEVKAEPPTPEPNPPVYSEYVRKPSRG